MKPPKSVLLTDESGDHTFSHHKSTRMRDNGRMEEEYIHKWPSGIARVRLDPRAVDAETKARKIKPNKVKKHVEPSREEKYRRDPNERIKC